MLFVFNYSKLLLYHFSAMKGMGNNTRYIKNIEIVLSKPWSIAFGQLSAWHSSIYEASLVPLLFAKNRIRHHPCPRLGSCPMREPAFQAYPFNAMYAVLSISAHTLIVFLALMSWALITKWYSTQRPCPYSANGVLNIRSIYDERKPHPLGNIFLWVINGCSGDISIKTESGVIAQLIVSTGQVSKNFLFCCRQTSFRKTFKLVIMCTEHSSSFCSGEHWGNLCGLKKR